MIGSLLYDFGTGSRVGTERALIMTLIVLGAVILDRRALSMRNLALAVLAIVAIEPEAVLGVSFQLSFAAVAALVAVMEARLAGLDHRPDPYLPRRGRPPRRGTLMLHVVDRPLRLVLAAAFATCATASFMAYHFHDLSPYVLIGNPLTLAVIECFAVPGALLGTALYPPGLDAPVWLYIGLGIKFILFVARFIADAPGATLYMRAFAPSSIVFLSLAVMSAVLWRSWLFRAAAIPLAALGLIGALNGPRYDAIISPSGDLVAVRGTDGRLDVVGNRFNAFAAEQWLAADGDDRDPASARNSDASCDRNGCIAALPQGGTLGIVTNWSAFAQACTHAAVVITSLNAPGDCQAQVFDRKRLDETGAVGLTFDGGALHVATDRSILEDRPWSPAPKHWYSSRRYSPAAPARTPQTDPGTR
jgi:competence protein ComEC